MSVKVDTFESSAHYYIHLSLTNGKTVTQCVNYLVLRTSQYKTLKPIIVKKITKQCYKSVIVNLNGV